MAGTNFLEPVKPRVTVAGSVIQFESLSLDQQMNGTHSFEVVQEFMSMDELWKQNPGKMVEQVGSEVTIYFEHNKQGISYEFQGLVTDVQIDSWDSDTEYAYSGRQSNRIHLIGHGSVIKLDNVRGMDSYVNTTLSQIFSENKGAISDAASSSQCNPKFTGPLQYVMRYDESLWNFFNRLSGIFGELFFFDGKKLVFGKPDDSETAQLLLGCELVSLRTTASATPRNYSRYDNVEKDGAELFQDSSPKKLKELSGNASKNNSKVYAEANKDFTHSEYPIVQSAQLKALLDARQTTADGSVLNVEGISHTCKVKIGGKVSIKVPTGSGESLLGVFRVMSIEHRVDKMGNYSNHFIASPIGTEPVTMDYTFVKAFPEVATVKSNADPEGRGRVQVQFDWQKPKGKTTNWIRVQSPDAGGSNMTNRGMVFVPEEGDQVMVGFEFGDPNRPYVMGSLFTGKTGKGGDDGNITHSITTKSGHKLTFVDKGDWSITIEDKNNNMIKLDTAGKSIIISAPEKISISANEIDISANKKLTVSSGKETQMSVGSDYQLSVGGQAKVDVTKDLNLKTDAKAKIDVAKEASIQIDGDLKEKVSGDYKVSGNGKVELGAQSDMNLKSGSSVNIG